MVIVRVHTTVDTSADVCGHTSAQGSMAELKKFLFLFKTALRARHLRRIDKAIPYCTDFKDAARYADHIR